LVFGIVLAVVTFCSDHGLPEHVSDQPAEVMIGNAADRFDAEGNLTDETTKDYIRRLLQNLVE
jgi:hypothetical protein